MKVVSSSDAASFLALAQPWLMETEVEHSVILSIATSIAEGSLVPTQPPYLAAAVDPRGVVACAVRTPPQKLVLSRGPDDAINALASDVFALMPDLYAVNGPEPAAGVFAQAWATIARCRSRAGTRQRLYVVHAVAPDLPNVSGTLRKAALHEKALALEWITAFAHEAVPDEPFNGNDVVDRHLRADRLFFWDDAGPAAMLVASGKTPNGARVGLVYTPEQSRRRGYATAAVAALTARLLAGGNKYCCLYTDLANPTSNSIYQRVGYRPLCDVNDYLFTD